MECISHCLSIKCILPLLSSGFHHLNINSVINDENLKKRDELEIGKVRETVFVH